MICVLLLFLLQLNLTAGSNNCSETRQLTGLNELGVECVLCMHAEEMGGEDEMKRIR